MHCLVRPKLSTLLIRLPFTVRVLFVVSVVFQECTRIYYYYEWAYDYNSMKFDDCSQWGQRNTSCFFSVLR